MKIETEIVSLPFGYKAEFGFDEKKGMLCEWSPSVPKLKNQRAANRLNAAYFEARNAFMQKVVNLTGKNMMIYTLGGGSVVLEPEE